MKQLMFNGIRNTIPSGKRISGAMFLFTLSLLAVLGTSSCRVQLLPSHDFALQEEITTLAKTVDRFYLQMLESDSTGRSFSANVSEYIHIETELRSILNKNRIKPLNQNAVEINEITLKTWIKEKEKHRTAQILSPGLIKLNSMTFQDFFYAMLVAEEAKKIIDKPDN